MQINTPEYLVVIYRGKEHPAGDGSSISFRRDSDGRLQECSMSDVPVGIKRNPTVLVVQ
ncbi:hypothetical protein LCGC14_1586430 [marine sediment metagenome]|uniref:Uncharacterized protein n=1 Tax=marine sediment metagenome TaxID=412755 RepID=A0A0F9GI37_9ZZZZ